LSIAFFYVMPLILGMIRLFPTRLPLVLTGTSLGWLDYVFHYPFWMALVLVLELTAPFVLLDILLLLSRVRRTWKERFVRVQAYAKVVIAAVALLYVPVRVLLDTLHVNDSEVRITIEKLPEGLEGFSIALVGDIQVDRYTGRDKTDQMRSILDRRGVDLVLSAGDLVTGGRDFLRAAERAVCPPQGRLASVAVMGDHDYWSAPESISAMQQRCGWQFLENEHRTLRHRGRTVLVSGLTHIYRQRLSGEDLDRFLKRAPQADLRILLTHQPAENVVEKAAARGYDLVLAGHTHGGQIVLHPLGFEVTPSRFETVYYSGTYQVGSTSVVVTRGIGLTLAPIRYHAPAEVTTILLSRGLSGAPPR
jgi:predicted MPP superfamily phosphohydrolase